MTAVFLLAAAIALCIATVYLPARLLSSLAALFTKFVIDDSTR